MPYGITGSGDMLAFTLDEAGTRSSDPVEAELT